MGIEKLKGSLNSEASEDAKKIVDSAEASIKSMQSEEASRRSAMKKEAEENIERLLKDQRNERIAWARLEAKRIVAEAREDAIKSSIEDFFESLGNVRKAPEYKKFLNDSVVSAISDLGSGTTLHVLKGDKSLLAPLKGAKVVEDLEGLGGVLAESSDGKIRVDFTLETLFETKRDSIRRQIYDKLFPSKKNSSEDAVQK